MNISSVITAITKIVPAVAPQAIKTAQRNQLVIKILQDLKLDPIQPPSNVEDVYAYALVEYGVLKPKELLELFNEKEVKYAFWKEFNQDNPAILPAEVEAFLDWHKLGDDIRALNINPQQEFEEFWQVFISVTQRTRTPAEVLRDKEIKKPKSDNVVNTLTVSTEFEPLIKKKIRSFCGRKFVFDAFDKFLNQYPTGYFTVIGDAGMGKSAIAAKYVYENKAICYFNVLQDRRNRPESFLKSIRQQLINRYQLENAENDDLSALLVKAADKIPDGECLVIVVDALDEVEQEPGAENILYLPMTLPDKVYFLLTRRRYEPSKKRLHTYVEQVDLDLTASQYDKLSRDDVQEYISFILNNDPECKDGLRKWIQERNIADETFIEQVADKSENNFMYLYHLLREIALTDHFNDLSLQQFPNGLKDYYQKHWERMRMDDKSQEIKVIVLFILVQIPTRPTLKMISDIANEEEYKVEELLEKEWEEYLTKREIDGEYCYSIYHTSFQDFLKAKSELNEKRNILKLVKQRISDYLY